MSIVDEGSVLILGAGSSNDFGLPLGGELIELIRDATTRTSPVSDGWDGTTRAPAFWGAGLHRGKEGFKEPIGATLVSAFLTGRTQTTTSDLHGMRSKAYEFGKALDAQTSDTIDDFISLNPSHALMAKRCIAATFAQQVFEFDQDRHDILARSFDQRLSPHNQVRNWIHLLINIVRHRFRDEPPALRIPIISFNYDGILERVLAKQFSNVEEEFADFRDYFEIIHPHGYCGDIPDHTNDPWGLAVEWAKNIWVVNEPAALVPTIVSDDRQRAKELITKAKHVYAAGFSFSYPNCELLGLYAKGGPFEISYHNYGNDIGLDLAVERIWSGWGSMSEARRSRIVKKGAGSENRDLTIADWIRAGYLGETPG